MERLVKVGFCVAYDWYFLEHSLPLVYNDADQICLSIDKERIGWAGEKFDFDSDAFHNLIADIDKKGKIKILEEDFHLNGLTPMQNEVRQRNKMAEFLGSGGWHIQLDADEYFVDFKGFVQQLQAYKGKAEINICVPFLILFKRIEQGWLMVSTNNKKVLEYVPIATLKPKYEYGRRNGYSNYKVNYSIIHQSWARNKSEIRQKIENWGHKNDFDTLQFLHFWEELDCSNFLQVKDFHPIQPSLWPSFEIIPGNEIVEILEYLKKHPPHLLSKSSLKKQNSLFRSRLRAMIKKVGF